MTFFFRALIVYLKVKMVVNFDTFGSIYHLHIYKRSCYNFLQSKVTHFNIATGACETTLKVLSSVGGNLGNKNAQLDF
jgi:hypothetical protein